MVYYIYSNYDSYYSGLGLFIENWLKNQLKQDMNLRRLKKIISEYDLFDYINTKKKPFVTLTVQLTC